MKNKLNVLAADDHRVITKAVSFIVKDIYKDTVVFELNKLEEVLQKIKSTQIDLLIMDVSFPEGNSLALITTIKALQPTIKILIFSGLDEDIYAVRCINAGANGFLSKVSTVEEIKNAINEVLDKKKYLSKIVQDKIMDNYIFNKPLNPLDQLTNRELEIVQLILEGFKSTEIAKSLNLQKSTISTYKNRIFEKLGIDNIPDLIKKYNLYQNMM